MTVVELIAALQGRGARLYLHQGKLRCNAPTGALTDELRQQLAAHRDEIVAFLRQATAAPAPAPDALPAAPARAHHPLSHQQRRLWFLDRLDGGGPTYNVPVCLRLAGELDRAALEASLRAVVQRHEALRVCIGEVEGEPVQRVQPTVALALEVVDTDPAQVHALAREFVLQPFRLAQDALIRGVLYRLAPAEHMLVLSLHHIVCDGWSVQIIARELARAYEAAVRGQPPSLGAPPASYIDFVHWQRSAPEEARMERDLDYWRTRLADLPRLTELPTDRPRAPIQQHRGARLDFAVDAELVTALKQLGRQHDCTLFMTSLAAFYLLLARYSGQRDIAIGTPIANRTREALEGVVGFFANTLVLRARVDPGQPFTDLLQQARETTLDAYAHQAAPFERVVEAVAGERSLSHMPLFQVELVFQNTPEQIIEVPGLALEIATLDSDVAKFDLSLGMLERDGAVLARLEYDIDLFDRATIERMAAHYQTLLRAIAANPGATIARLDMLPPAERDLLCRQWNPAEAAAADHTCVHELFEHQARRTPDIVALGFRDQHLSYAALDRRADRLSERLRAEGIGPDLLVGLCLHRTPSLFIGVLGILKAGGAYVPLDPAHPRERLAHMITESAAPVILTEEALRPLFDGLDVRLVLLDTDGRCAPPAAAPPRIRRSTPDSLAYVLYTSGSTGTPKGVALEHRTLVNMVRWYADSFPLAPGTSTLQFASIGFDVSFEEAFTTWNTGGTLVMLDEDERLSPRAILDRMAAWSVERVIIPVVLLQALAHEHGRDPSAPTPPLRQIITSGSQLQVTEDIRRFCRAMPGCELHNNYGPAETHAVTREPMGQDPDAWAPLPSIGRSIANTRFYVVGDRGELVPIGVKGELLIGGVAVGRGYWKQPALTAERFVPDPYAPRGGGRLYRTGDLVRAAPDGRLSWMGRLDDMVKVRGVRIELGEIESALRQHPGVREVAARVWQSGPGCEQLVAYIEPVAGAPAPANSELRAFLQPRLPGFMLPSRFVRVAALPVSTNGKIDRRALPDPGAEPGAEIAGAADGVAPRTEAERIVADAWVEMLEVARVGIHDNFFTIGGHSLLASRVVARLHQVTGIELPLRVVFDHPTVAEMAAQLEERLREQRIRALRADNGDDQPESDEEEEMII